MGCSGSRCISISAVRARVHLRSSDNVCEVPSILFEVGRYETVFGGFPAFSLLGVYKHVGTGTSLLFQGIIHASVRDVIESIREKWINHCCLGGISAQEILRVNFIDQENVQAPLRNLFVALISLVDSDRSNALGVLFSQCPRDTFTLSCREQSHLATPRCEHIQGILLAFNFATCIFLLFAVCLPVRAICRETNIAVLVVGKVPDDANVTVRGAAACAGYTQGSGQQQEKAKNFHG